VFASQTLLQIMGIPGSSQNEVILFLSSKGFTPGLDFNYLYVPQHFIFRKSLGYAFVNFVDKTTAVRAQKDLTGCFMKHPPLYHYLKYPNQFKGKALSTNLTLFSGLRENVKMFSSKFLRITNTSLQPVILTPKGEMIALTHFNDPDFEENLNSILAQQERRLKSETERLKQEVSELRAAVVDFIFKNKELYYFEEEQFQDMDSVSSGDSRFITPTNSPRNEDLLRSPEPFCQYPLTSLQPSQLIAPENTHPNNNDEENGYLKAKQEYVLRTGNTPPPATVEEFQELLDTIKDPKTVEEFQELLQKAKRDP